MLHEGYLKAGEPLHLRLQLGFLLLECNLVWLHLEELRKLLIGQGGHLPLHRSPQIALPGCRLSVSKQQLLAPLPARLAYIGTKKKLWNLRSTLVATRVLISL